ncbi:unnamed protein product, partial [Rotaria socialis]
MAYNLLSRVNGIRKKKARQSGLLPIQELVVNAIHATINAGKKEIKIDINFDFEGDTLSRLVVTDYGKGFDTEEQRSFKTADSSVNDKFGCKGSGGFSVLRSFNLIKIDSFDENGKVYHVELGEKHFIEKTSPEGISEK